MALIFALLLTPLLGFVALAFDVGSAVWARSQLNIAADAAALSAVTKAINDYAANPATSMDAAQKAGVQRFHAQADIMPQVTVHSISVGVKPPSGNMKITAVVSYTATFRTQFAGLFGVPELSASGISAASRVISEFFELSILMDTSSSMAIGASQADMNALGKLVRASPLFNSWGQGQNCAFGCHFDANNNDFYGLAKANGVSLRIDVLRQAVTHVIQTVQQSKVASQFLIGLYSFNKALNTVLPPSNNLQAAVNAAGNVTLPVTTEGGDADTNITAALQGLASSMPASGDGSSVTSPVRYLFIITDGVADYVDKSNRRVIAPLDPTQCAALKAKGIRILTLYTQYIPIVTPYVPTNNAFYQQNVAPFSNQIFPNMQACASSTAFSFQATDGASIDNALQLMLQAALSQPSRFTQ